jgi:DNA-binding PadR family transcriptional regulator
MFRHHHRGGHPAYGRGPFGFHGGHGEHGGGHRGRGGLGRFFEHGDLRFVLLKLIADQPSHGYELIKAVEQAVGGAYTPSPGVVYPTLTLLEELGYLSVTEGGGGKKLYSLTAEGQAFLEANARHVEGLFARMAEAASRSTVAAPRLLRAQENLKTALRLKLTGGALTEDQIGAVARILDDAADAIERA